MRKAENSLSGLVLLSDDSAEDEILRVKQCLKMQVFLPRIRSGS